MTDAKSALPFGVFILEILTIWLAAWNGLRLGAAIFFWNALEEYDAHPLYISMSGGVWLTIGLFLVWILWNGKAWGRMATIGIAAGYTSWYWLDRMILQKPLANWPFTLTANLILMILILLILFTRKTERYFQRDAYERK